MGESDAAAEMERILEEDGIENVLVEFPDLDGIARSKQIDASYFRESWRDGFSMNMLLLAVSSMTDVPKDSGYGEAINFADGVVIPIPSTFRRLPWRDDAARVLCRFEFRGEPAGAYTRGVLRRVLDELDDQYTVSIGNELELQLLKRDADTDQYRPVTAHEHECVSRITERVTPVYDTIERWTEAFDIETKVLHHEYGAGQLEVLFEHGRPLPAADRAFDFREIVKEAAVEHDRKATFMAKPATDAAGNGHHLHVSVFDEDENAFADGTELSEIGRWFVGGVLEHADALTALCCPTLNSFKRFEPGSFSPFTRSWGYNNRTAAVRVPESKPIRIENRVAGADVNPYLLLAGTLAAGFHGIREELDPDDPVDGDAAGKRPPLPQSQAVALRALESDDVLVDALGEEFVDVFTAVKQREHELFNDHVTDWERRYLAVM